MSSQELPAALALLAKEREAQQAPWCATVSRQRVALFLKSMGWETGNEGEFTGIHNGEENSRCQVLEHLSLKVRR